MILETYKPAPPGNESSEATLTESRDEDIIRRILVVDDEEAFRCITSSLLARAGFEVTAAPDGEEAWKALRSSSFDLLVTDNEMPRLAGLELIERMRNAGMNLSVIITSGSFSRESARDYPRLHIAAILPKPFRVAELLAAVECVLSLSHRNSSVVPPPRKSCSKANHSAPHAVSTQNHETTNHPTRRTRTLPASRKSTGSQPGSYCR